MRLVCIVVVTFLFQLAIIPIRLKDRHSWIAKDRLKSTNMNHVPYASLVPWPFVHAQNARGKKAS